MRLQHCFYHNQQAYQGNHKQLYKKLPACDWKTNPTQAGSYNISYSIFRQIINNV